MPHVKQGLLVQGLVLEHREHALGALQHGHALLLDGVVAQRVLDEAVARVGELPDRMAIGPRADAAARRGALLVLRIDAPREDLLEARVHR
jgi:hypothetical protein